MTYQRWSPILPRYSLRVRTPRAERCSIGYFNKYASISFCKVRCLEELRDADLNDMQLMNQRNLPVAIFHGTHDKICPFDLAKVMNEGINVSRLIEFNESVMD